MKGWIVIVWLATTLVACGGGDSDSKKSVPDLVIFFVSGHTGKFDGDPSTSYLSNADDAGPNIVANLRSAGYTVDARYFVDDAYSVGSFGGYQSLVLNMWDVRDNYVPFGTRVIVISHSHGGVWAHAAILQVSNLPVTAEVDLDNSSYGWAALGHDVQNSFIGGDPRDEFYIDKITTCPTYSAPSENTALYDIEDVVFSNVRFALEVRSGDSPLSGEWYDEKWNIRVDGTTNGLSCYYSGTDHTEVHQPGVTLTYVENWLRSTLKKG